MTRWALRLAWLVALELLVIGILPRGWFLAIEGAYERRLVWWEGVA